MAKRKKVWKYKCRMCGNEFDKPLKHKYSKLTICPKLGCGYIVTPLIQKY